MKFAIQSFEHALYFYLQVHQIIDANGPNDLSKKLIERLATQLTPFIDNKEIIKDIYGVVQLEKVSVIEKHLFQNLCDLAKDNEHAKKLLEKTQHHNVFVETNKNYPDTPKTLAILIDCATFHPQAFSFNVATELSTYFLKQVAHVSLNALFWLKTAAQSKEASFEFIKQHLEQMIAGTGIFLSLPLDNADIRKSFSELCDILVKKYHELKPSNSSKNETMPPVGTELAKKSFNEVKDDPELLKKWQAAKRAQQSSELLDVSVIENIKKTLEKWPNNKDQILEELKVEGKHAIPPLFINRIDFSNVLSNIIAIYHANRTYLITQSLFSSKDEIGDILNRNLTDHNKVSEIKKLCQHKLDNQDKNSSQAKLLTQILAEANYAFPNNQWLHGELNQATNKNVDTDIVQPKKLEK